MTANASLLITISAKDLASAVFKQIGDETKASAKKAVKSLGDYSDKLADIGNASKNMGKNLSIGVTAPLTLFAGVAVNSAVKAERLTKTLNSMAGGADRAASFINAIKTASLGTVPQIEALEIANKALSFGVVETEQEMASLVETAIVLGKSQGLDAATAVGDLTTALSRQSPMILDNLGITLKLTEAYQIYADKLGVSVDSLDAAQKSEAFRTAALIKGAEAAASMGGMQEDMAMSAERVQAQMKDLTTTIGGMLVPVMSMGVDIMGPMVQKFADMDPAVQKVVVVMAALAAGAGPAMAALGTLATVASGLIVTLPQLVRGMQLLKAGVPAVQLATSSTMGLATVLGTVAIAALAAGAAIATYYVQSEKVSKSADKAVDAAGSLSDRYNQMIDDGRDLGSALSSIAIKQNQVTSEWNSNIVTGTALGAVFGSHNKILKVYEKTQGEVNKVAVKNTSTYAEYTAAIKGYNAQISDGNAKVEAFTQSQYEMAQSGTTIADSFRPLTDMVLDFNFATQDTTNAMTDAHPAWITENKLREASAIAHEQLNQKMQDRERIQNRVSQSNEQAQVALYEAAAAEEAAAKVKEYAARTADAQASSAMRQAAALEISRQAAVASAEAQTALAGSLKGATDAQIASTLIEQLDPDALGATAYAEGVQQIQLAFGLADEKSIAMAEGVTALSSAINEGILPYESYDEALQAMIADAADGEINTGLLLDQFARAPGLVGPSKETLDEFNQKLVDTIEEAPEAATGLIEFGDAAANQKIAVQELGVEVDILTGKMESLEKAATGGLGGAQAAAAGADASTPRYQFGGVVPGPIGGPPRLVLAEPGERFIPPSQQHSLTNNYGGNTQNVYISDDVSLAAFEESSRHDRLSRLNGDM